MMNKHLALIAALLVVSANVSAASSQADQKPETPAEAVVLGCDTEQEAYAKCKTRTEKMKFKFNNAWAKAKAKAKANPKTTIAITVGGVVVIVTAIDLLRGKKSFIRRAIAAVRAKAAANRAAQQAAA